MPLLLRPQRWKSPPFACRNPCTAGVPGHLIPFGAGGCPLEFPRLNLSRFISAEVFLTNWEARHFNAGPPSLRTSERGGRRYLGADSAGRPSAGKRAGAGWGGAHVQAEAASGRRRQSAFRRALQRGLRFMSATAAKQRHDHKGRLGTSRSIRTHWIHSRRTQGRRRWSAQ